MSFILLREFPGYSGRHMIICGGRFAPDSFEVRHVRAPGQIDIDLDSLLKR